MINNKIMKVKTEVVVQLVQKKENKSEYQHSKFEVRKANKNNY